MGRRSLDPLRYDFADRSRVHAFSMGALLLRTPALVRRNDSQHRPSFDQPAIKLGDLAEIEMRQLSRSTFGGIVIKFSNDNVTASCEPLKAVLTGPRTLTWTMDPQVLVDAF